IEHTLTTVVVIQPLFLRFRSVQPKTMTLVRYANFQCGRVCLVIRYFGDTDTISIKTWNDVEHSI
ncbi:hypothetical protein L9F63_003301, partial [Diploptera punctata]